MIIRRNNTLSRRQSQGPPNDLLPLREKESASSEEGPLVLVPSATLNPENPITSVLVSDKPSGPIFRVDREQSQFSFKQGSLLAQEDPQQLQARMVAPEQKTIVLIRQPQKSAVSIEKVSPEEGKPSKARKAVGTITNIRQGSAASRSQSSEKADTGMRKPCANSLGSSRLEQVLNRIKSLRLGGVGDEGNAGTKMRYSTTRHDESKVESTSTSGEEPSPIKKEVISSIRKHVERMNLSLAKDHRIRQEQSDTEELSFLFKPNEVSSKPVPQDLLQSKNKSFLVRSTNKKSRREGETVQISYKTSILQLKELSGRFDESMKVKILVPASFSAPIFHPEDSQEDLFDKAVTVLRELGAACLHPMTIRKYANCVLVMADEIGLLSYFSGHVYFGGWQEDGKSGMGLEVVPSKFVYYGEFRSNRREGYGVMKDWQGTSLLGQWHEGKFMASSHSSPLKMRSF